MQLKLFIETSVLQKREKPRYKAVARVACEKNTQEKNQKKGRKPGSKVLRRGWKTKGSAVPGSFRLHLGVGCGEGFPPPPALPRQFPPWPYPSLALLLQGHHTGPQSTSPPSLTPLAPFHPRELKSKSLEPREVERWELLWLAVTWPRSPG